jgi:hypothetical protein
VPDELKGSGISLPVQAVKTFLENLDDITSDIDDLTAICNQKLDETQIQHEMLNPRLVYEKTGKWLSYADQQRDPLQKYRKEFLQKDPTDLEIAEKASL